MYAPHTLLDLIPLPSGEWVYSEFGAREFNFFNNNYFYLGIKNVLLYNIIIGYTNRKHNIIVKAAAQQYVLARQQTSILYTIPLSFLRHIVTYDIMCVCVCTFFVYPHHHHRLRIVHENSFCTARPQVVIIKYLRR